MPSSATGTGQLPAAVTDRDDRRTLRDGLLADVTELLPALWRALDVRPDAEQRAQWRSLTVHQLEALVVLDQATLTMRELCEQLDISESAGTALSDRLVARGMVERHVDPEDRRVVRLAMSDQARSMAEQYRALKRRHTAEALSVVSTGDLTALVRICRTLTADAEVATVANPSSPARRTARESRQTRLRQEQP